MTKMKPASGWRAVPDTDTQERDDPHLGTVTKRVDRDEILPWSDKPYPDPWGPPTTCDRCILHGGDADTAFCIDYYKCDAFRKRTGR